MTLIAFNVQETGLLGTEDPVELLQLIPIVRGITNLISSKARIVQALHNLPIVKAVEEASSRLAPRPNDDSIPNSAVSFLQYKYPTVNGADLIALSIVGTFSILLFSALSYHFAKQMPAQFFGTDDEDLALGLKVSVPLSTLMFNIWVMYECFTYGKDVLGSHHRNGLTNLEFYDQS